MGSEAVACLANRAALADLRPTGRGYGPLRPKLDQRGRAVLALPAGFTYVTFGDIGSPLSDGTPTPLALDGMAAFRGPRGAVRLIRNHEDRNVPPAASVHARPGAYDPVAGGGTTTLDYDPRKRRLVRSFISLDGATINCAGGFGLRRRSWLTGEETTRADPRSFYTAARLPVRGAARQRSRRRAGQPAAEGDGPLSHEAAATDHRTGIVYETEDPEAAAEPASTASCRANRAASRPAGGSDPRDQADAPVRRARGPEARPPLDVKWIDIPEPDPEYDPTTIRAGPSSRAPLGAAKFDRLEGCWYADGSVFFVSTSGGDVKSGDTNPDGYDEGYGQVWEYGSARASWSCTTSRPAAR